MPLAPELFRALGALCEPPDPAHERPAAALGLPGRADPESHTELFVFQLVPYASVYLGPDGMLGGEPRDRIAGFWRALRLTPPAESDHLAALLGLYARLSEREREEPEPARRLLWGHARRTLLAEHLLTWLPPYAHAVTRAATASNAPEFYAAWARLLSDALAAEARGLGVTAGHLGDVPALPGTPGEPFIRALLAPARSGLILTRGDLARGARKAGLGLRVGERAFVLRSLIDQDPVAAFAWLAGEAAAWEAWHAGTWAARDTGPVAAPEPAAPGTASDMAPPALDDVRDTAREDVRDTAAAAVRDVEPVSGHSPAAAPGTAPRHWTARAHATRLTLSRVQAAP